jgi:hypothetical protein
VSQLSTTHLPAEQTGGTVGGKSRPADTLPQKHGLILLLIQAWLATHQHLSFVPSSSCKSGAGNKLNTHSKEGRVDCNGAPGLRLWSGIWCGGIRAQCAQAAVSAIWAQRISDLDGDSGWTLGALDRVLQQTSGLSPHSATRICYPALTRPAPARRHCWARRSGRLTSATAPGATAPGLSFI